MRERLAHHVSGSNRLCAKSGECRKVDGVSSVLTNELDWSYVVIDALFLRLDKCAHELANEWRILELVAAGAAGHKEPVQARLVVQRDPVVGDVVQSTDAQQLQWNTEIWQAPSQTQHHSLEELDRYRVVPIVCVIDEMQFVACWLGGANVEQVAHVRAEVLAEV